MRRGIYIYINVGVLNTNSLMVIIGVYSCSGCSGGGGGGGQSY